MSQRITTGIEAVLQDGCSEGNRGRRKLYESAKAKAYATKSISELAVEKTQQ